MAKKKKKDDLVDNAQGGVGARRLPIAALVASIGVTGILAAMLVMASSWISLNTLDAQQGNTVNQRSISEDGLRAQYELEELTGVAGFVAAAVQQSATEKRPVNVPQDLLVGMENLEKTLGQTLAKFHTSGMSTENLGRVEKMRANYASLKQLNASFLSAVKANNPDQALQTYKQIGDLGTSFRALADELYKKSDQRTKEASAEFDAAANQARTVALLSVLIGALLTAALTFWLVKRIGRSLSSVGASVEQMSKGDFTHEAKRLYNDELGDMSSSIDRLRVTLQKVFTQFGEAAHDVGDAAGSVDATSTNMVTSAGQAASVLGEMSDSTSEMARSVDTVAAGTEEMTASIREIAKSANDAAGVASQAVSVADATNSTVAKLGESSAEIGNVIKVITSIAEQTNLLALNATIEAARAGEAGKGFAVVANEVKELAQETSKATEDISRRIEEIQHDTEAAVSAISEISSIIAQINDTQSTIASAVEEQTATTNEMGRNVVEVSGGSRTIAEGVSTVAEAAKGNASEAQELVEVATALRSRAEQLRQLVGTFQY